MQIHSEWIPSSKTKQRRLSFSFPCLPTWVGIPLHPGHCLSVSVSLSLFLSSLMLLGL